MPPGRPLLPFNKLADEAGPEPPLLALVPLPLPLPLPAPAPVVVPLPALVPAPVPAALPFVVAAPAPLPVTEAVVDEAVPGFAPAPPDKPAGVEEGETEGEAKELVSGRFPPSEVVPYRDVADVPDPEADGNKSPYRDAADGADEPGVELDGRRLVVMEEP